MIRTHRTFLQRAAAFGVIVSVGLMTVGVSAAERDRDRSRGHVDGSAFAKLANDGEMLVEVTLSGAALLKLAAGAVGQEVEGAEQLLNGIQSINAVVVGVKNESERAEKLIEELGEHLRDEGWDRMARIREEGVSVSVYVLPGKGDVVDGITVMVREPGDDTLVFANIAGHIDLRVVAEIGMNLDIPGLEHLTSNAFKSEIKKKEKKTKKFKKSE